MAVSPDGRSLFLFGRDIYEISTESYESVDTIVLSEEGPDGYGSVRLTSLQETEPGVYFSGFRTSDPFHGKEMFGVARLDVETRELETFEVGPDVRGYLFAVSPDGERGYAGLTDLAVIDMEQKLIVNRKEEFERGRANSSLIVSWDGSKLYASGVGHEIQIYDAGSFNLIRSVDAGGDVMLPPASCAAR